MATSTEIQSLLDEAKCFSCYSNASLSDLLKLALLNQIAANSVASAIQGQSGNYGGGQPTWTPTSPVAISFDLSTTPATQWLWYDGAWH